MLSEVLVQSYTEFFQLNTSERHYNLLSPVISVQVCVVKHVQKGAPFGHLAHPHHPPVRFSPRVVFVNWVKRVRTRCRIGENVVVFAFFQLFDLRFVKGKSLVNHFPLLNAPNRGLYRQQSLHDRVIGLILLEILNESVRCL